jgi:RNA polymerase sigma-70 factor (ECF subfamily)
MEDAHSQPDQEHLKELILLAKDGDKEAFEEVYSTYYIPLYRYILNRIKDRRESEDMAQVVFMKIWNSLPTWDGSHTSPLSFFFTVARNTLIDYFRKNARRKEIVSDEVVEKFAEHADSGENQSKTRELGEILRDAISKLSEDQQEIINLFYAHDRTYEEIAEITGKREDAIRQTHSRAIKKLRELYEY